MKLKNRYALAQVNSKYYGTLSGSGVLNPVLTDAEFKDGKAGYIYAPYIVVNGVPDFILAKMKRESLKNKLEKIKKDVDGRNNNR